MPKPFYKWRYVYMNTASNYCDATYSTRAEAFAAALRPMKEMPGLFNDVASIVVKKVDEDFPDDDYNPFG